MHRIIVFEYDNSEFPSPVTSDTESIPKKMQIFWNKNKMVVVGKWGGKGDKYMERLGGNDTHNFLLLQSLGT